MKLERLKIALPDIVALFEELESRIIRPRQLNDIVATNRKFWRLGSITVREFIEFMLKETPLTHVEFEFPHRREVRYLWGEVSIYDLALSLQPAAYFAHYTAVALHDLTEQIPKTIYLNHEQPAKPRGGHLEQGRIDAAFKRKPRISSNFAVYENTKIYILNGMQTGGLGVVEIKGPGADTLRVTNLERTLIDIAVRPFYAGGAFEVLKAYESAAGKASVNRIAAILKKMAFVYPYHQSIGFLLERAGGYSETAIDIFRRMEKHFDFYLTYNMRDTEYSEEWRLHFPKGL